MECCCDLPRYVNPACPSHGAHEYHGDPSVEAAVERAITLIDEGMSVAGAILAVIEIDEA